jgi:hypothetical protein
METDAQLEDEGEVAGEVGVEVAQHEAVELRIQKIIAHFVFPGAKPGSLEKVGVRVLYSDGSRSDYIPAGPFRFQGASFLHTHLKSKNGQRIQKYI